MIKRLLLASVLAFGLTLPMSAQDFAIQNAKIWTGTDQGLIESGSVLVRDGEIVAVGDGIEIPASVETVDANGRWVTPGMISSFSRTGIVEVNAEDSTDDRAAPNSTASASLMVSDGFNPDANSIDATRIEGVTRIVVALSLSAHIIGGQGFVADTSGAPHSLTDPKAFMFIDMGEAGAAMAGGSRPALWAKLRSAIEDARTFPARYATHDAGDALKRPDARAFGPAVRGQQLILVRVSRASDILKVLALKEDMPQMRIALVGAEDGWRVAQELARANIPVIVDPYTNLPERFEAMAATQENAKRLIEAGVPTAFAYMSRDTHQARLTLQVAGNAVGNGVAHDDAMHALTTVPASIFGLDSLGVIASGKTADLVLWDGDPLEVMSAPDAVWIDGAAQSMTSRQTELRDRYIDLEPADLPVAYRH